MQLTLDKTYLGCQYLFFTQPVPIPDLWDQLGFLVTKILGDDSHSIFPPIIDKNSTSSYFSISKYLPESRIFTATPYMCDSLHRILSDMWKWFHDHYVICF